MQPSADRIAQLKTQFSDRSLHIVDVIGDDGEAQYCFIMTSPSSDEMAKFCEEAINAEEAKDAKEQRRMLHGAISRAAMAQIRWPERDEVRKIFEYNSEMLWKIGPLLRKHAGEGAEFRSKKL